jgi:hypothetical protein
LSTQATLPAAPAGRNGQRNVVPVRARLCRVADCRHNVRALVTEHGWQWNRQLLVAAVSVRGEDSDRNTYEDLVLPNIFKGLAKFLSH